MPTSLSLLIALLALAVAIAGASLVAVTLVGIAAIGFEVYATGSGDGLG